MTKLQNKVVWITGASSGIGEALVYQLSKEKANLIISARRKRELGRVKNSCPSELQKNIHILPFDLSQPDSLKLMSEAAINYYGRIDILINNGGVSQRSLAKDTLMEVDRQIMEVNYFSAVALTKYLLPGMIENKSGHIVTMSSILGKFGVSMGSGYCASKHALHGFFDALRIEHWKDNIKITLICPGYVDTNVSVNALTADGSKFNKSTKGQVNGMSAKVCARKIVKTIKQEKEEIYMGGSELSGVYVKRYWPGFFTWYMKRFKTR